MKRLVCAALAITLLGTTAAVADPYGRGGQGYYNGNDNRGYSTGYRRGGDGDGGAILAGVGLLTLAAILASQHHHHWHQGWYGHDGYRYDGDHYGSPYGRSYGSYDGYNGYSGGYGDRHEGWSDHDRW